MNIDKVSISLELEDAKLPLQFDKKEKAKNKTSYLFSHKDREVTACITLESTENMMVGYVSINIENHPFWENFNLSGNFPVGITLDFGETPENMCALYQHRDWWTRPAFINSYDEIPDRTQSLYIKNNGSISYILPMVGEKTKTYISKGKDSELYLSMTAYTPGINCIDDVCFILYNGDDPYKASEKVFQKACELRNIPMKSHRVYPEMFEYFGWCSWDAFYTDIDEEKVLQKIYELKDKKIPVRWVLMDDGWLNIKDRRLVSFEPDHDKFPNEFKDITDKIKSETDIDWIGVWHTLAGYWGGIAPDSDLALKYKENLYETKNGKLIPHYKPELGSKFWRDWYSYLRDQGIDFVKVDGQSALKNFYKNNEEIGKVAFGTHMGLEGALNLFMNGNIINCMGMAMENILNRPSTCISRNSDDFVPNEENSFREHMLQNTYNALYHDNVNACDWDMYWTNHIDAKRHALARAISGGPIYISDRIGDSVYEEIIPLVYNDGRILRMDRCAKPTMDCIFDPHMANSLIKLTNTVNGTGAIAVFNISEDNKSVKTGISPSHIYDLAGATFGAYDYFNKTFEVINREKSISLELNQDEYALMLFVPVKGNVIPIGLINKYMSTHAVKACHMVDGKAIITLIEGGVFAFYTDQKPKSVIVNDMDRVDQIKEEKGFYSIDISDCKDEVLIVIDTEGDYV